MTDWDKISGEYGVGGPTAGELEAEARIREAVLRERERCAAFVEGRALDLVWPIPSAIRYMASQLRLEPVDAEARRP